MKNRQEQINNLQRKIESWLNLKDDLGEETVNKEVGRLQRQLHKLTVETDGGAAVGGNVDTQGGDFTGRDKITNIYQGAYHGLAPKSDNEALRIYRQTLMDRCGLLPLQGFSDQANDAITNRARLSLPGVYIQLNTDLAVDAKKLAQALATGRPVDLKSIQEEKERRQMPGGEMGEGRKLSVLHAAILSRKLVLLGDPGSGKTTFLNYLAHCLAVEDWESLRDWPQSGRETLPLLVTLRDFAYWLAGKKESGLKGTHALWAYISDDLKMRNLEFAVPLLEKAAQDGKLLLLLDGLDEVPPTLEARGAVLASVQALAERYPKNRYLVTCRVLSYEDPQWQLPGNDFPALTLSPFDDKQIEAFIHAWHNEIAVKWNKPRQAVEKLEKKLLSEVTRRTDLHRLAPNPLLLTVMALVHTSDGELPEARALLYGRAVEILLWRWEQEKGKEQGAESLILSLLRDAGRSRGDLLVSLAKLAYEAHQQVRESDDSEAVTGIPEKALLDELRKLHPKGSLDWAEKVINTMKLRAGLLLERTGGTFTFPHRTFQEYLAGMHLARQPNFSAEALRCVEQGDFWRIVVLLAVGYLVHANQDYEKPRLLIDELCPDERAEDDPARRRAWLAGEALLELGINRAGDTEHGRRLLKRVRLCLVDILEGGALTPRERLEAGDTLGALGDPRFGEKQFGLPTLLRSRPEPTLGFVHIPAGKFIMGSDKKKDEQANSDEQPAHPLELPEFYMARYPVTNAQFRHFVETGGYDCQKYWTPEGWAMRNGEIPEEERLKIYTESYRKILVERIKNKPNQPYWWNHPQWGAPTRPAVGISWYESLAYCRWLGEQLSAFGQQRVGNDRLPEDEKCFWQGLADGSLRVTLPTEAQWEKAARGEKGLRWPWGNKWEQDRANVDETGLKQTSPAGMFPAGASSYGALDLAGNVWEWTASRWGKDPYKPEYRYPYRKDDGRNDLSGSDLRVLRGGSWFSDSRDARCALRRRHLPANFNLNIGFRVVVSLAISDKALGS